MESGGAWPGGGDRADAGLAARGQVSDYDRFAAIITQLERDLDGDVDPAVADGFALAVRGTGMLAELTVLIEEMGRKHNVPGDLRDQVRRLTGRMRSELARVSVSTLEPDLIILDEFQRFRHLLDESCEAGNSPITYSTTAKPRLLLSATPYKPFTYAEETDDGITTATSCRH